MRGRREVRLVGLRRVVLAIAVGGPAVLALAAGAASGTTSKPYTAAIAPREAASGATQPYTYAVTDVDPQQQLGGLRILIPPGLTLGPDVAVHPPAGKSWTTPIVTSTYIEVSAIDNQSKLGRGEQVIVSFSASSPSCTAAGTAYVFQSDARQSNRFQGPNNEFFQQNPNSDRTVTLTAGTGPATSLAIDSVGSQVAGTGFPVTVRAADVCGSPTSVNWSSASLSGLAASPDGTTPIHGTSTATSGASATFSSTTAFKAGSSTLTATLGSISSAPVTFAVAPGSLDAFTVDTIASPQEVGTPFAVKASAFDQYGNAKTDYAGGAVAGASATAPLGLPTYGSFGPWSGGSATASVTAGQAGLQRKVRVSDGAVAAESNAFDVADEVCSTASTCTAAVRGNTSVTVDTSDTQDFIALQLLAPTPAGGTVSECGPSFTPDGYGVTTTTKSVPGLTTVTFDISKAVRQTSSDNGLAKYNVCFGGVDPSDPARQFPLKPGFDFTTAVDLTLDNLSNTFAGQQWGVIPDCTDARVGSATSPTFPCLQSTQSVGGGARIVFLVPRPWDWAGRIG